MNMLNQPILVLKKGTEATQGKSQIISNIEACQAIVEVIRSTLGPRGMDKMIIDENGTTISNDGATIIKLLNIEHPAAKSLADVAKSQDNEVGDGTTSVMLFAGELLKEAKQFIEDGMSPQIIINGYWTALKMAKDKISRSEIVIDDKNPDDKKDKLLRCAQTSLNSKLIANYKEFFSKMIVEAVDKLDDYLDKDLIGIKHVTGGSITDSFLVEGVAFKKTFSYAGFEQQRKKFNNPKIIILNVELELKSEKENSELRIEKPEEFQKFVDAEWKIITGKLENIKQSGANIVLSKLPIGDLATQYFADIDIFCAGRVPADDIERVSKATGAKLLQTCSDIPENSLGTCGEFEEKQIGAERFNIFSKCEKTKTATIILRGGAEQFIEEAERSINDAIMVVRRAKKTKSIVPGGGAIEMDISKYIRKEAMSIKGKDQLVVTGFARALEVIPRTLAQNSALDAIEILSKLRKIHNKYKDECYFGVNCFNGGIIDTYVNFVWEPTILKENILNAATEAACSIISVDQTVKNPKSEQAIQDQKKRQMQKMKKLRAAK